MTNQLNVDVNVDVKNDGDLKRVGTELDNTAKSAGNLGSVGQGVFQGIGIAAAGAAIGIAQAGIGAAVDAIGDSIGLASDKAESASKAQVLFGNSYGLVADKANDAATTVGVSSGKYLELAGNVGNLVTNFGFAGDEAANMSTDIVALAADVGSFNNAPTADVVEAIGAAFRGETEPIRRFGVMLSDATVKQKALELGLWDGQGALDASAKATATYQLILEGTANAQGDFARTSDGLANGQKIANARIEESLTKLGDVLMPIVQTVLPLFADVLVGIIDTVVGVASAIGELIGSLQPLIHDVVDVLSPALEHVANLFGLVREAVGFLGDVLGGVADGLHNVHRFLDPTMAASEDFRDEFRLAAEQAGLTADEIDAAWRDIESAGAGSALAVSGDIDGLIEAYRRGDSAANQSARAALIQSEATERALHDTTVAIEAAADAHESAALRARTVAVAYENAVKPSAARIAEDYRESMRFAGQAAMLESEAVARRIGTAIPSDIGDGMIEKSREILDAADRLIQLLKEGLSPAEQAAKLAGVKYTNAVAEGVRSEIPGAKLAAQQMAVAAINTIEDAANGAPGTQGLRAIGSYYDSLLASGLTSGEARASLAAAGVGDSVIDTLERTASGAAGAANAYVTSFTRELLASRPDVRAAITTVFGRNMAGQSPPPEGPLRWIVTRGAGNVGRSWIDAMLDEATDQRRVNRALASIDMGAQLGRMPVGTVMSGARGRGGVWDMDGGGAGNVYQITIQTGVGDPVEIGRQTVNAIRAYERASGTEAA